MRADEPLLGEHAGWQSSRRGFRRVHHPGDGHRLTLCQGASRQGQAAVQEYPGAARIIAERGVISLQAVDVPFRDYRRRRQVVEHAIARLVQRGIRQARYHGIPKTLFQALMAAAVVNLTLIAGHTGDFWLLCAWLISTLAAFWAFQAVPGPVTVAVEFAPSLLPRLAPLPSPA